MAKLKHIKKYKELLPEVGVTYQTKICIDDKFCVAEIIWKPNSQTRTLADIVEVKGQYIHLDILQEPMCPLRVERLILHNSDVVAEEYSACPHCGEKIDV